MLQLRRKETLDRRDHGWLKASHHFVVSADGNPAHGPLGALVVWNDDEIAPGTGFGHHTHADMEIITYVRKGSSRTKTAPATSATPQRAMSR
jgi:redox-sensitive bicupin YhaK (pirin superfamily)